MSNEGPRGKFDTPDCRINVFICLVARPLSSLKLRASFFFLLLIRSRGLDSRDASSVIRRQDGRVLSFANYRRVGRAAVRRLASSHRPSRRLSRLPALSGASDVQEGEAVAVYLRQTCDACPGLSAMAWKKKEKRGRREIDIDAQQPAWG